MEISVFRKSQNLSRLEYICLPAAKIAVTCARSAQRIGGRIHNRIIIAHIQAQAAAASAGVNRHSVETARAAHARHGCANDAGSGQAEIGHIHAGHGFGEVHAG